MKELKISAIREGTVIDHIPSKNTFKVAEILAVKDHVNVVSVATNLKSKKMGTKGIIKVGGRNITSDEVNKIALLAPHASVAIIKDYNVVKKYQLELQQKVHNLIRCNNPKCITNMENIPTKFTIVCGSKVCKADEPFRARCDYCERVMSEDEIEIK